MIKMTTENKQEKTDIDEILNGLRRIDRCLKIPTLALAVLSSYLIGFAILRTVLAMSFLSASKQGPSSVWAALWMTAKKGETYEGTTVWVHEQVQFAFHQGLGGVVLASVAGYLQWVRVRDILRLKQQLESLE